MSKYNFGDRVTLIDGAQALILASFEWVKDGKIQESSVYECAISSPYGEYSYYKYYTIETNDERILFGGWQDHLQHE